MLRVSSKNYCLERGLLQHLFSFQYETFSSGAIELIAVDGLETLLSRLMSGSVPRFDHQGRYCAWKNEEYRGITTLWLDELPLTMDSRA